MGVFVILLLVPIMIQHFVIGGRKVNLEKKNNGALLFFFLFLTFLVALRHENVGADTKNYIYFFNNFAKMEWHKVGKYSLEIGFSYFNKIISTFTKEPRFFLIITSCITMVMIYPTYKRVSVDTSLTIVLFCIMSTFVMMFSGIRQMLAVGIGFIAYEFTHRKKLIPFILCVLLAVTFHTSAFMLIFMYPLYHTKITKKMLLIVIPILAFIFVFNRQIFFLLGLFLEQYAGYDASMTQTGAYTMLILFAMFAVFSFVIPDDSLLDNETIGLRNFLLLSLILQMFAPLHSIAMRMNYYYIIFIPLLLPRIILCKSSLWQQVAVFSRHLMLLFFLVYFFITAIGGGGLHVFPYHFFWESI